MKPVATGSSPQHGAAESETAGVTSSPPKSRREEELPALGARGLGLFVTPRPVRERLALPVLRALAGLLSASPGSTLSQALGRVLCTQLDAQYALEALRRQLPFGVSFIDWDMGHCARVDVRDRKLLVAKAREACGDPPRRRGSWCVTTRGAP